MKNILSIIVLLAAFGSLKAQNTADTIFKRNGEVLIVKITEIGIDEVKYKPVVNPNDLVLVLEKGEIKKIVFSNGVTQTFADPLKDRDYYADNHRNNVKFNFLSPTGDRIHLNFERSLQPGLSYELGLNAIGIGKRFGRETPAGATINAGIRLYRVPDMKSRSDRYSHLLNGAYFQPALTFGLTGHQYKQYGLIHGPWGPMTNYNDYQWKKATTGYFMFSLNLGKQFIFQNRISFDFSAGMGYGTYSNQISYDNSRYREGWGKDKYTGDDPTRYGFFIGEREVPIALNAQFKIGYLFR